MNENTHIITTVDELKNYIGKLVVTHYSIPYDSKRESIRILTKISGINGKIYLKNCHIYGKFILMIRDNGRIDKYFNCHNHALYSSNIDYVRLPTIEEKHKFMELYSKYVVTEKWNKKIFY